MHSIEIFKNDRFTAGLWRFGKFSLDNSNNGNTLIQTGSCPIVSSILGPVRVITPYGNLDNHVYCADNPSLSFTGQVYTAELIFAVKPLPTLINTSSFTFLLAKKVTFPGEYVLALRWDGSCPIYTSAEDSSYGVVQTLTTTTYPYSGRLSDGQFHYLAASHNLVTKKGCLYVDGCQIPVADRVFSTTNNSMRDTSQPLQFGVGSGVSNSPLERYYFEAKLSNIERTAGEISESWDKLCYSVREMSRLRRTGIYRRNQQ